MNFRTKGLASVLLAVLAVLGKPAQGITISEISYNPGGGPSGDSLEFVEVTNDSHMPFDLSGCYFARGIEFVFPEGTFLRGREAIAVCANAALLEAQFPEANAIGDFAGRLDSNGETITLATPSGAPLAEVRYNDRAPWPAVPNGSGYTLSLRRPFDPPGDPASWTWSGARGGTPGAENFPPPTIVSHEVFPEGTAWRYRKSWNPETQTPEDFSSPPGAWREPAFDDAAWPEGPAPVGFGETEIATVLDDMADRYISFALRKRFQISEAQLQEMVSLTLAVRVDDGCVAYLNGVEIGRTNLAGDPGSDVPYGAAASLSRELKTTKPIVFTIPREKTRAGENVLAVQVHNKAVGGTGADAGFASVLAYQTLVIHASMPSPSLVLNEVISRAPPAERGLEVFNTLRQPVDASGFKVAPGADGATSYAFPPGTLVPARGFLQVPESALGFSLAAPETTLFLLDSGGDPLDAVIVEDPVALPAVAQSHARHPDASPRWWISTRPSPGAPNRVDVEQDLVLNEIHYNPKISLADRGWAPDPDTSRGELVEVFNRSARTIALDGFRLSSGFNYAFPPGSSIAPGGFLVVARSPKYIRETYGLPPEQVLGPADTATQEELDAFGTLRNGGETVRLVDSLGNVADEVTYREEGEWDELADGGGSSLELIDPTQDNGSPHAWAASFEAAAAPWTEISYEANHVTNLVPPPMESELHIYLISEGVCLLDGISLTQGEPPVEVIPNGGFEADTRPWRLAGTHIRSQRTTDEAKEGSACLRMVATGSGDNRVNRIEVDTTPQLKAGKVKLRMWARWVEGCNALHVSGYNNSFGKTVWLPVPAATGTPGRENSARVRLRTQAGSDNLGPVISRVSHEPAVPGAGETVLVRATVTDQDGLESVEVLYQKDAAAAFERAPMLDDGAHEDGEAGDGVYAGEIPGYALKTLVNFMVEAKDKGGRTRTFPRLAPERTLTYIADDKIESPLFRYRLLCNQKNLNTPNTGLARRLLHSDELVRGTFVFDESEVYYDIGLRYRGSPWNRPPDPKMFRIRFNGDKPFLDGVKRINVSRYGTAQNEGTSYHLLYKAGTASAPVPHSPRYHYISMKFNGVAHGTTMSEIRPIDGSYTRFNWPHDPDGEAWKVTGKLAFSDAGQMAGSGPDWTQFKAYTTGPEPGVLSKENARYYFNTTLRNDEDIFDPLLGLLRVMDRATTPDAEYDVRIAEVMQVESSLRVFAVRSLLADWDTIDIGNGQNAYIYHAPIEGRSYLVPWDMDHTFERSDVAIAPTGGVNGFRRLIGRPVYKRMYARILAELNATSWSQPYVTQWTTLVAESRGPNGSGNASFINGRRGQVTTFIRTGMNVPFKVTTPTPSGAPSATATVAGTAGLEVAHVFASVNGDAPVEADAAWSTPRGQTNAIPTIWQIQVGGLVAGRNTVEVLGFTGDGDLIDSGAIEVYDTTGWQAPAVTSVSPPSGPLGGGTPISVQGSGFQPGVRVEIGGKPALEVALLSAGEAAVKTPDAAQAGPADVVVTNLDGQAATLPGGFSYGAGAFRRGEVDGAEGINLTDAVAVLGFLFQGRSIGCEDAADIDDSGAVNLTDAVVLLLHLFQGGAAPPEPFDQAGADPTPDDLGCGG
ncbi:MAG: lamin tail domain-containing protein [Planctomycetes bacterium]|nr:lamin tail domain-containing protein [Planctomycetota bacterium]